MSYKYWKEVPEGHNVVVCEDVYVQNTKLSYDQYSILFKSDIDLMFNIYIPAYTTLIKEGNQLVTINGETININPDDLIIPSLFNVLVFK